MPPTPEPDTQVARRLYDALGVGDSNVDALCGVFAALDVVTAHELARRLHQAEVAKRRGRKPRYQRLPDWVPVAWVSFQLFAELHGKESIPNALGPLVATPEGAKLIADLILTDRFDPPELSEELRALIQQYVASHRPAARSELEAFFSATRGWFHVTGRGDPTGRVMALLSAIAGLETLEDGLETLTARWNERAFRWRRKGDAAWPDWRQRAASLPL